MDAFSYLSVLLSIIVGLAITQVLQGYRALLLARRAVRLYPPTMIWTGLILLICTQFWWASFGLRTHTEWTFLSFFTVLLQAVGMYMVAAVVLPDIPAGEPVDLKAHYYREHRTLSLLLLGVLAASLAKTWALDGYLGEPLNLAFHGVFGAAAVVTAVTRRPLVHEIAVPAIALAMASYIGVLFARL